jgi:hypothetical protein
MDAGFSNVSTCLGTDRDRDTGNMPPKITGVGRAELFPPEALCVLGGNRSGE